MWMIDKMEKSCRKALPYGSKEPDAKLRCSDEKWLRSKEVSYKPDLKESQLKWIKSHEVLVGMSANTRKRVFHQRCRKFFKVSTIKSFDTCAEVATDYSTAVSDTETFVLCKKYGHLVRKYIPAIKKIDLEDGLIKVPVNYESSFQRVLATDRLWSSGDKRSAFVQVSGGAGEGSGQRFPKELQLFKMSVYWNNKNIEYVCLRYIEETALRIRWTGHLSVFVKGDLLMIRWPTAWGQEIHFRAGRINCRENI